MKTLVVTEEYGKLTTGLFRVWSLLCAQEAHGRNAELLVNHEHWLDQATAGRLAGITGVHRFPLSLPQTIAARVSSLLGRNRPAGILRFALRNLLNLLYAPMVAIWLAILVRRRGITHLVCHHGGWPAGPFVRWAIMASRLIGVDKTILVIHSFPAPYSRLLKGLQRIEERLIGLCASEIVTVSEAAAAALAQRNFRKQIRVIHNGMRASMPSLQAAQAPEGDQARPLIGFLGALVPDKGAHVLLDALLKLTPGGRVALAGPGQAEYTAHLRAHPATVTWEVSFVGELDDVSSFLQQVDILVVPSIRFEAFGMVILEAMEHCKPVICSDFGGMKEIVVNGETGMVVPAGDPDQLAAAIATLEADPTLRKHMGTAGHARLRKCFTVERMAAQYAALLS